MVTYSIEHSSVLSAYVIGNCIFILFRTSNVVLLLSKVKFSSYNRNKYVIFFCFLCFPLKKSDFMCFIFSLFNIKSYSS